MALTIEAEDLVGTVPDDEQLQLLDAAWTKLKDSAESLEDACSELLGLLSDDEKDVLGNALAEAEDAT